MNRYKVKPNTGREFKELDFGLNPQKLQEEYLDLYEGIQSDKVSSNRFDENSDISTTCLGRVESKGSQDKLRVEVFSNIREWLHFRQIIRWYKMPATIGHRH